MTTAKGAPRRRIVATAGMEAAAVAGAAALAKYVAISYSPGGRTRGNGSRTNLDTAVAGSLGTCGDEGGHCEALAWSKNGCVALAVSGEY